MDSENSGAGTVIDNVAAGRFELEEQGLVAFATYRLDGEVLAIPHVEAPFALRGKGTAGRLMQGLLTIARERGLKVLPICPYAVHYLRRRPEYEDLQA